MSYAVVLDLSVECRGRRMLDFPIVAGLTVERIKHFRMARTDDGVYEPLPISLDPPAQFFAMQTDDGVRLRLNGQITSNVPLNDGGFLLIFGATPSQNLRATVVATTQTHLAVAVGG